mmetsp:Transcript_24815/g.72697  ORF Transcript_24815/g.72697 Transcript_24815/m.72697 type:complete len:219 (-) Transcript_24815:321-977(-)
MLILYLPLPEVWDQNAAAAAAAAISTDSFGLFAPSCAFRPAEEAVTPDLCKASPCAIIPLFCAPSPYPRKGYLPSTEPTKVSIRDGRRVGGGTTFSQKSSPLMRRLPFLASCSLSSLFRRDFRFDLCSSWTPEASASRIRKRASTVYDARAEEEKIDSEGLPPEFRMTSSQDVRHRSKRSVEAALNDCVLPVSLEHSGKRRCGHGAIGLGANKTMRTK